MPNFQAINIPWIKLDTNIKIPTQKKKTNKQTNKQNTCKTFTALKDPEIENFNSPPKKILALIWKAEHEGGSFVS